MMFSLLAQVDPTLASEVIDLNGGFHVHMREIIGLAGAAIMLGRILSQIKQSSEKILKLEEKVEDKEVIHSYMNRTDLRIEKLEERMVAAVEKLGDRFDVVGDRFTELGIEIRAIMSGQEARLRVLEKVVGVKED